MNCGSGIDPSHAGVPSTTTFGTAQTSSSCARCGNSFASIAVAVTRSEARAQRNASSTAGGQCGQVGVTKTSSATSRSSSSSAVRDSGRSAGSSRPASTIAPMSEPSS